MDHWQSLTLFIGIVASFSSLDRSRSCDGGHLTFVSAIERLRQKYRSALSRLGVIDQLWRVRGPDLPANERGEARKTFDKAIEMYKKIAEESEAWS